MKDSLVNKINNLRLECSLILKNACKSAHFRKYASIGYFDDIVKDDDFKNVKMIDQILKGPKYQAIQNQLKGAPGVVNFVTNEEFEPLVELLIKKAFPPTGNDIFNMGFNSNLPSNYFIDASYYFGGEPASASNQLGNLFMGSTLKMTKEWLDSNNVTTEMLSMIYGEAAAESMKSAIEQYEAAKLRLKSSDLAKEIDSLSKKLRSDGIGSLDPDVVKELTGQLRVKEGFYVEALQNIENNPEYNAIVLTDKFSKIPARNNDGFMNWDPTKDIQDSGKRLSRHMSDDGSAADEKTAVNLISSFIAKLTDYYTTDSVLINYRSQILKLLDNASHNGYLNLRNRWTLYSRLITEFMSRVNQHGKVMIMKDVEDSALCVPARDQTSGSGSHRLQIRDPIDRFVAHNNANLTRDQSQGKSTKGNRTVVIVSNAPLANLPKNATVVELKVGMVDEQEATIIVDNLLEKFTRDSQKAIELKLNNDIEEKYQDKNDARSIENKNRELHNVDVILEGSKTIIESDARDLIVKMINGLSIGQAIRIVNGVLSNNAVYKRTAEGILNSVELNSEKISGDIITAVNELSASQTRGITVRSPKVEYKNYAYKKVSKWGDMVGSVGSDAKELERIRIEKGNCYNEILRINMELLDSKLSAETKEELLRSKSGWEDEAKHLEMLKHAMMAKMAHFIILYGPAGVGKSVWADALGSLLGYSIQNVELSALQDKWLGNTAKFTEDLIRTMLSARNTIFLMDEIDRMLEMGHGSEGTGGGGNAHSTAKQMVKRFLDTFQDQKEILIRNDTFVIMTSNNIEGVDTPLIDRSEGNTYSVEASDDPSDFMTFFNGFLETEEAKDQDSPWFVGPNDLTPQQGWLSTRKLYQSLDFSKISQLCAEKELPFRFLESILKTVCKMNSDWLITLGAISRGEKKQISGLPLTTENILQMIKFASTQKKRNSDYDLGAFAVKDQRLKQLEEITKGNLNLKEGEYVNPRTKEVRKSYTVGDDIVDIMSGKTAEQEEDYPKYTVDTEIDPETGEGKKKVRKQTEEEIQKLKSTGFEELDGEELESQKESLKPLPTTPPSKQSKQPKQPETPKTKEETDKEKKKKDKEVIKSSTDYLFDYLMKQGMVSEDGKFVSKEDRVKGMKTIEASQIQPQNVNDPDKRFNDLATRGVYDYGWCLIAPATVDTPPQFFKGTRTKE